MMKVSTLQTVSKRIITGVCLGTLFWTSFVLLPPWFFSLVLITILALIIVYEWQNLFDLKQPTFWLLMPIYPVLPFLLLIALNHSPYRMLLLILFVIVSAHDTASYFIGSFFGKHKIAPPISPNKTWEGFWGGYLVACGAFALVLWERDMEASTWFIFLFTLCVCTLSLLGDLFESWLKRRANVKDSGTILPGHGGFLDRFDGVLFVVFFFYFFREYLSTHIFNLP